MEHNSISEDEIAVREKEYLTLIKSIKDIYLGMYSSLDDMFLDKQNIDIDRIHLVANELLSYTKCEHELSAFYLNAFLAFIFYLYSECNKDDRIFISLKKLADTVYKDHAHSELKKITFGIMIDSITPEGHRGFECVAYEQLLTVLPTLEEAYDKLPTGIDLYAPINQAVNHFVDQNGISCLQSKDTFDKVINKLCIEKNRALYFMEHRT